MAPSALHKLYGILIALLVAVGSLAWRRHDIQQKAVQAYELRSLDSTKTTQLDSVAQRSRDAVQAASQAQAQKLSALRLVAAGEALRAKQDSLVKVSANERARAEAALRDSLATVGTLRSALSRLDSVSRADSTAAATVRVSSQQTIVQLLAVVRSDSVALTAEQRRSQSLQALTETLTREVGLLKKAQPSTFGNVVRVVGWAGAGFALGHILK